MSSPVDLDKIKNGKLRWLAEHLEDGKTDAAKIFARLASSYPLSWQEIERGAHAIASLEKAIVALNDLDNLVLEQKES